MKIVIIGAGIGGLQTAKVLAEGGVDVTVYERSQKGLVSYDWRDDVEYTVFDELDIPIPEDSIRTQNVAFLAPGGEKIFHVFQEQDKMEWGVERRTFSDMLASRAEKAGAKIVYGAGVEGLILDGRLVKGVTVDGKEIQADLVVDCSGVDSKFRASLPKETGVQNKPNDDEVFTVYRAFVKPTEGAEYPECNRIIYLKPNGLLGISWCVVEEDGPINVLVGKAGIPEEGELEATLKMLKERNPIISDEVVRGGIVARIPIRHTLHKMVTEGYVAIGDAAYMTIPLIGSGIAASLRAGQMLGEEIVKASSADVSTLWKYQVKYYKTIAKDHYLIDALKRKILVADPDGIKYVLESGFITEDNIKAMTGGEGFKLTFKEVCTKIKLGVKKLPFILDVAGALVKGLRASKVAESIPEEYDELEIARWSKKLDKFYYGK